MCLTYCPVRNIRSSDRDNAECSKKFQGGNRTDTHQLPHGCGGLTRPRCGFFGDEYRWASCPIQSRMFGQAYRCFARQFYNLSRDRRGDFGRITRKIAMPIPQYAAMRDEKARANCVAAKNNLAHVTRKCAVSRGLAAHPGGFPADVPDRPPRRTCNFRP